MALRLYDYNCDNCSWKGELIVPEKERLQICPECRGAMDRPMQRFNINMGPTGAHGYYDDNLESYVSTNAHRKELMRQKGVTEKGGTPKNGATWV